MEIHYQLKLSILKYLILSMPNHIFLLINLISALFSWKTHWNAFDIIFLHPIDFFHLNSLFFIPLMERPFNKVSSKFLNFFRPVMCGLN